MCLPSSRRLRRARAASLFYPLGLRLEELRWAIICSGTRLLSCDEREREVAERRGGESDGFKPPDALIMTSGILAPVRHLVTNDEAWKRRITAPLSDQVSTCYLEDYLPFP